MACLCLEAPGDSFAVDSKRGTSLESYLEQLGYHGLDFENSDQTQPRIGGSLSNGRKLMLVVDTGWGVTSLSPPYARGLKTLGELGTQLQDPVMGTVTNRAIAIIDKLVLGSNAQFSNQPALVRDLKMDFISIPYDGVLGLDFLLRNFCLIDCWKHRLYVRARAMSQEEGKGMDESLRRGGFSEMPLSPNGPLTVESEINGHLTLLEIDTGAAFNMLDNSQIKELGLNVERYSRPPTGSLIPPETSQFIVGTGKIGLHTAKIARLDSFQLGERKWKNVDIAVTDLKAWGAAIPGTRLEYIKGWLSEEFLARHGVMFDVARRKLWFRAVKATGSGKG